MCSILLSCVRKYKPWTFRGIMQILNNVCCCGHRCSKGGGTKAMTSPNFWNYLRRKQVAARASDRKTNAML